MSKINRFFQKVFASNYAASPTGQICQFGSLAGGTAVYSGDPATIQSLPAWLNGWNSATVGSKSPTFQDFNAFQFVVTQQLAYLLQAGIPEYDASTTYYIGSWCQVAGVVYKSVIDNNTGNAVSNPTYWVSPFATVATTGSYADLTGKPTAQLCKAWVNYNAVSQVVNSSFNVNSVNRNGVGDYTINFTSAFPDSKYCVVGSSTQNANSGNGAQTCGVFYSSGISGKNASSCRVYSTDNSSDNPSDPIDLSFAFYSL